MGEAKNRIQHKMPGGEIMEAIASIIGIDDNAKISEEAAKCVGKGFYTFDDDADDKLIGAIVASAEHAKLPTIPFLSLVARVI